MPLKIVFLRPQKMVSTKTLLLKHYYRCQGLLKKQVILCFFVRFPLSFPRDVERTHVRGGGGQKLLSIMMVCGFVSASSKPTTEFAQPRLSRDKARSSPARGYKFGCVCSYIAGREDAGVVTGHIGTNTPKFGTTAL